MKNVILLAVGISYGLCTTIIGFHESHVLPELLKFNYGAFIVSMIVGLTLYVPLRIAAFRYGKEKVICIEKKYTKNHSLYSVVAEAIGETPQRDLNISLKDYFHESIHYILFAFGLVFFIHYINLHTEWSPSDTTLKFLFVYLSGFCTFLICSSVFLIILEAVSNCKAFKRYLKSKRIDYSELSKEWEKELLAIELIGATTKEVKVLSIKPTKKWDIKLYILTVADAEQQYELYVRGDYVRRAKLSQRIGVTFHNNWIDTIESH